MIVGIVGFGRSGKTTIFNALTGSNAAVGAYGSRDVNVAVLKVPDERVERLDEIFHPKKKTLAEFQFVDIAPNESTVDEKALDAAALSGLKNVDALVHVVRCFDNENVLHPLDSVDPLRDCIALEEEFQLDDLMIVEKRTARLEKENEKGSEYETLIRCKDCIESGSPLRKLDLNPQEEKLIAGFTFLSQKPLMLLGNYGDESIGEDDSSGLQAFAAERGLALVSMCGAMELELSELSEEERASFREELGLGEESRALFLRTAYDILGLMSFFTVGEDEVRAWTAKKETKAAEGAGLIHSDLQRGFIRAEVVTYDDFIDAGSMHGAKEQGHLRIEGKDCVLEDGDIVLIRFNV